MHALSDNLGLAHQRVYNWQYVASEFWLVKFACQGESLLLIFISWIDGSSDLTITSTTIIRKYSVILLNVVALKESDQMVHGHHPF